MGCALSHINIWLKLLREQENINSYLVLEDDVRFNDNWKNEWKQIAENSHSRALELFEAVKDIPFVTVRERPQSNAVFAKIPSTWVKPLRSQYFFYVWDENTFECRWMTSWDTTSEDVQGFAKALKEMSQGHIQNS